MDLFTKTVQEIADRCREFNQVNTTGKTNLIEYDCARCEKYKPTAYDILQSCKRYKTPFEATCNTIKQKWHAQLVRVGIYERFWDANFLSIETRGIPEKVRKQFCQVKSYCDDLDNNLQSGRGLLLKGPAGTMKTTLAVAVLQETLWRGYSGKKILMQSLLDEIFTLKARNIEDWLAFEKTLREARLLIIDELGKHKSEGWVMTKFEAIVSERHERRRSTIFITNMTADEIKGLYSEGVVDRFNHVNSVVNFIGGTQRVKGD